jgi:hypothetical protein
VKLINWRSEQGGATKGAPANWTTSLATVFQSKYPGTVTTYYPYSLTPSVRKIPTWLGAVIGVILGVAVIGIFLVWLCYRRRPKRPRMNVSEADSRSVHESGGGQVHELGEYVSKDMSLHCLLFYIHFSSSLLS